jgi:hypothetical protein
MVERQTGEGHRSCFPFWQVAFLYISSNISYFEVPSNTLPGFLRVGVSYRQYANADCRIFDFSEGDEEIGGKLIEWELTEKKGGGLGKSPKGVFLMSKDDYPEETEKDIGEAVSENPT